MSKLKMFPPTVAFCLAAFVPCFPSHLLAENGRNFAGSYQLSNVRSDASTVTFELSLKLFNYSGGDVQNASVTFEGRMLPPSSPAFEFGGAFERVAVKYRKFVDLKGRFTVPESEYLQWRNGAMPHLVVKYLDQSGDPVHNDVELVRNR